MRSHPVWVCGLKLGHTSIATTQIYVTPCMGVWIETRFIIPMLNNPGKSHPVWVCGLKLGGTRADSEEALSHPVWVCGLKHRG